MVEKRYEIEIRVLREENEMGIKKVKIWDEEEKIYMNRLKEDERYKVGRGKKMDRDIGKIERYI